MPFDGAQPINSSNIKLGVLPLKQALAPLKMKPLGPLGPLHINMSKQNQYIQQIKECSIRIERLIKEKKELETRINNSTDNCKLIIEEKTQLEQQLVDLNKKYTNIRKLLQKINSTNINTHKRITNGNKKLSEENDKLSEKNNKLSEENNKLSEENNKLSEENIKLQKCCNAVQYVSKQSHKNNRSTNINRSVSNPSSNYTVLHRKNLLAHTPLTRNNRSSNSNLARIPNINKNNNLTKKRLIPNNIRKYENSLRYQLYNNNERKISIDINNIIKNLINIINTNRDIQIIDKDTLIKSNKAIKELLQLFAVLHSIIRYIIIRYSDSAYRQTIDELFRSNNVIDSHTNTYYDYEAISKKFTDNMNNSAFLLHHIIDLLKKKPKYAPKINQNQNIVHDYLHTYNTVVNGYNYYIEMLKNVKKNQNQNQNQN
jgi:hypothetical protein